MSAAASAAPSPSATPASPARWSTTRQPFIEKTAVDAVIATDAGCLMNIGGCLNRRGAKVRILHLAELLAQT